MLLHFLFNNIKYIFMGPKACLAQRPERRTCNAMVIGSTPIAGYIFYDNKSF